MVHRGHVGYHEVDGILGRTANLQGNRQEELDEEVSHPIRVGHHFIVYV